MSKRRKAVRPPAKPPQQHPMVVRQTTSSVAQSEPLGSPHVEAYAIYRASTPSDSFPGSLRVPCLDDTPVDVLETHPNVQALFRLRGGDWFSEPDFPWEDPRGFGHTTVSRDGQTLRYIGAPYRLEQRAAELDRILAPAEVRKQLPALMVPNKDPGCIAYWLWSHDLLVTGEGPRTVRLLEQVFGPPAQCAVA